MTTATTAKPSPAPRQPGLRATFHPRKEESVFLARGERVFTLPGRQVRVRVQVDVEAESDEDAIDASETTITISIAKPEQDAFDAVARWIKLDRLAKTSLHGVVNEDRATFQHAWAFELLGECKDPRRAIWAAIYAFWIRHKRSDRLPVLLQGANAKQQQCYLIEVGLGFASPTETDLILLDRNAFWEGAGAPADLDWLQTPVPSSGHFPYVLAFTQSTSPPVLATHPLRPPKPAPGSVVYSRYVFSCSQHLELVHIDASNPQHFEAYCRWQNSDRVNHGWREKGPDEKHRKYIEDKRADPHAMGVLVLWDGVLAGYGEMVWSKEDGMAAFVGGLGNYDQGTHLLIGEEAFRGKHRFTACMVSLKHACFLRDPRTEVVVGEPRYDLDIIPLLATFLPQEIRKEVELPHKRAVFFVLRRDRFLEEGILE
ncbi:related to N6-hydroxylysine acetyl transferase [Sporisorium reilianum f. sp. reilianum]|uniref:Related to N6-hydroxylysine acetyl transferase n=1 Tax=Sporisorium reilianum f. sp. reilianum TaxID=72559 RepID=A0A2N8U8X2_9BASI|nr:related to N6-hydroxylysine acetyl transferase [Sporisorium reilianum f. sp. reilianum]